MKFVLASLSVSAAAASCFFESDPAICPTVENFECNDQCELYKSEGNCPDTCEWTTNSFFGMSTSSCERKSADSSCFMGNDELSCSAIPNCAWTNPGCKWNAECVLFPDCLSINLEADCKTNVACKWEDISGSGSFKCWPNYDFDDSVCEGKEVTACGTTSGCGWDTGCEERERCDFATKAGCITEDGCFWAELAGTTEISGMGQKETQSAKPACMECFTDIAKTDNVYQGFKDKEQKGCSIYGEVSAFGTTVTISGSIDILSVTPAGATCTGGKPNLMPVGATESVQVTMDCSYAVGKAPMGTSGAGFLVPSALALAAAFIM